jgi:hypothetical protein
MNNYLRAAGVLAVALCAINAQAYKYSVINNTVNDHEVYVRFQDVAGIGAGEGSLGNKLKVINGKKVEIVEGKGGTASKNFDLRSGRLIQCIMPQLRIDESDVAMLSVTKSQLDDMVMMQNDPKMLNAYIANNKIRPETGILCFDRLFVIFQGTSSASYIVVTLKLF